MTPTQWLKSKGKKRTLLATISYLNNGQKTAYVANGPFQSLPSDLPANIPYDDLILTPPRFSRRMGIFTGSSSAGRSTVTLADHPFLHDLAQGNAYSQLVTYAIGDEEWPLSDFIPIASQLAERLTQGNGELSIEMRDPSFKLNQLIDTGVFSAGNNKDKAKPLCFGQVFNIEPVIEDAATHKYRVHYQGVTSISEVRDNGVSVSFAANVNDGSFTLNQAPAGRITCDVSAPFATASSLINEVLTNLVGENNVADLSALPNYPVGLYYRTPPKARQVIDYLCASINGFHFYTRQGQFVAQTMPPLTGTASEEITLDDIIENGVKIRRTIEPASKVSVKYAQNYTVQADGLAGSVSSIDRARLSEEWKTVEITNSLPNHPSAQPIIIETCLVNEVDAIAVAQAKASIASVKRTIYEVQALSVPFLFELGQEVQLTYWEYGFLDGLTGLIIALDDNAVDGEVTLELWR